MKIIEVGGPRAAPGRLDGVSRSLGRMVHSQARTASDAQDAAVALFKKILDNRFILLRGVRFQSFEGLPPLILVGPPGIYVIESSPLSGIFRSSGDSWETLDPKTREFRAARPNLPRHAAGAAKSVEAFLAAVGETPPSAEAVVLFTHPGAHLELQQPAVRLVQADAMGRFAAGLLKAPVVLEKDKIQALADRLGLTPGNLALEEVDELAEFSVPDAGRAGGPRLPAIPEDEPELVKRVSRFTTFSRFQWGVLALLVALNIFVLIAVILIVLLIT